MRSLLFIVITIFVFFTLLIYMKSNQTSSLPEQRANLEVTMQKNVQNSSNTQSIDQDVVLGHDNAPITLIEYASLSCGGCAKFSNEVFPDFKAKYIDTGKVRFIMRDFPLNASALHGFILARCAGKEKYYDVVHTLFAEQKKWAFGQDFMQHLAAYGKKFGVSQGQFDACVQDKQLKEKITSRMKEDSKKFSIKSTPSFILNGQKLENLHNPTDFIRAIDAALEKK